MNEPLLQRCWHSSEHRPKLTLMRRHHQQLHAIDPLHGLFFVTIWCVSFCRGKHAAVGCCAPAADK